MLKKCIIVLVIPFLFSCCNNEIRKPLPKTLFEISDGKETNTYQEVIEIYKTIAKNYPNVTIKDYGETDSGYPLQVIFFNYNKNPKNVLLINNGIHPGESDGIDASLLLLKDLVSGKLSSPENLSIAIIPVYNIGGALQRNSFSRANQNGPEEYGFRGNARNFDLNRDFIKCDTKNAKAFAQIFHDIKPNFFIDNHVSNGANYQYTLTHLFTQHNRLGGALGAFLQDKFIPQIEKTLLQNNWEITPYVNIYNEVPDNGFSQFVDYPRYSTGYTSLFNTLGVMVETHMLKPYKNRVLGTYQFMKCFIEVAQNNSDAVIQLKHHNNFLSVNKYPVAWRIDSTQFSTLQFKGFEASYTKSEITNQLRLKYDEDKPFTKPVKYYNYYTPTDFITIPKYYVIPKGYWNVVELLKLNNITLTKIPKDTVINSEIYFIENYQTYANPYEGHYPHYNTKTKSSTENVLINKGDYLVSTQQEGIKYLLETLEPSAQDSFFNWNFFDAILQQKEGFSSYVWEDTALQLLKNDSVLKNNFEKKKAEDPQFLNNAYLQLDWIYKNSPYYEKSHLRYPIIRVHH